MSDCHELHPCLPTEAGCVTCARQRELDRLMPIIAEMERILAALKEGL